VVSARGLFGTNNCKDYQIWCLKTGHRSYLNPRIERRPVKEPSLDASLDVPDTVPVAPVASGSVRKCNVANAPGTTRTCDLLVRRKCSATASALPITPSVDWLTEVNMGASVGSKVVL